MSSPYGEDIAVLKDQMKDVKVALDRIETKLDTSNSTYATKQELKTFKWITVPMVILLTAVLTALVLYYLSRGKYLTPEATVTNNNTTSTTPGSGGSISPSTNTSTTTTNNTTTPSSSGGLLNDLPKVQLGN